LPPGGQAWLSHYVRLGFCFAAFRYDAAAPDANAPTPPGEPPQRTILLGGPAPSLTSQTVRLSFSAQVPYFPYLEPLRTADKADAAHEMQVWLVSEQPREPRLRRSVNGHPTRWAWAWERGVAYERRPAEVANTLGQLGKLLPATERLHVQTFRDRRVNRNGWGDVVFPPAESELDQSSWSGTLSALLGDLDKLIHFGTLEPSELAKEDEMRAAPSARGCACGVPRRSIAPSPGVWLAAAVVTLLAWRRRHPRPTPRLRTVIADARLSAPARRVRPRPVA
jgi:hypothetical protein